MPSLHLAYTGVDSLHALSNRALDVSHTQTGREHLNDQLLNYCTVYVHNMLLASSGGLSVVQVETTLKGATV